MHFNVENRNAIGFARMEEFRIHVIDIRYLSLLLKQKKFQQKDFLTQIFLRYPFKVFSLEANTVFYYSITLLHTLCNDSHPFRSLSLYRFFLLGKKTWWKNSFVHVEFISKNYKSILYIYNTMIFKIDPFKIRFHRNCTLPIYYHRSFQVRFLSGASQTNKLAIGAIVASDN